MTNDIETYQAIQTRLDKLKLEYEADHRPHKRRLVLTRKLCLQRALRDVQGMEDTRQKLKHLDTMIHGRGLSLYGGGA